VKKKKSKVQSVMTRGEALKIGRKGKVESEGIKTPASR